MPRDGSFELALLGRVRVHDPGFSFALGRSNLALKRIVDLSSCSPASFISGIYNETQNLQSVARPRLVRRHGLRSVPGISRFFCSGRRTTSTPVSACHKTVVEEGQSCNPKDLLRGWPCEVHFHQTDSRTWNRWQARNPRVDTQAANSARSINAQACTAGANIAFAPGQYEPESTAGRTLLAHELTHTLQRSGDIVRGDWPTDRDALTRDSAFPAPENMLSFERLGRGA